MNETMLPFSPPPSNGVISPPFLNFPLPWWEGIKGRGTKLSSTPTLTSVASRTDLPPAYRQAGIEGEGTNWFNMKTATG